MSLHIAVILPERYRGGTLRGAKNIARMINGGAKAAGEEVRVTFAHVDDAHVYESADFADLRDEGIGIRPFKPSTLNAEFLNPYIDGGLNFVRPPAQGEYIVFNDGMSNLEDADFWVIVSDRVSFPIPSHRRYAVVVYDYIQRYVPEIFGTDRTSEAAWMRFDGFARVSAYADFVICTTRQTRRDCISYAGADSDRVLVFPMEFDPILPSVDGYSSVVDSNEKYVLWTTNSTEHKNHINVLEGLERFFREHPESKLKVRMSGYYTHLFSEDGKHDPHFDLPYPKRVRRKIAELPLVSERLTILGNIPDDQYVAQLRNALFVMHSVLYDNGTYSVVEGAWHGIPSISSDYPAMREVSENFSLPIVFYDARSPQALADALEASILQRDELRAALPSRNILVQRSFENIAPQYWSCMREALNNLQDVNGATR